jgi:hypothetical protein
MNRQRKGEIIIKQRLYVKERGVKEREREIEE